MSVSPVAASKAGRSPIAGRLITLAVATGCVLLALPEGGHSAGVFSAFALAVWLLVVAGIAIGRWPRATIPTAALAVGGALTGLAILGGLSLLWGSDDGRGFEDVVLTLAYLGLFAMVVLATREGEAKAWLSGLGIGLLAVAGLAVLSRLEPGLLGDADAEIAAALPAAAGRLSYPIGYWNGLAAMMAMAIALLTWLGAHAGGRAARALATAALLVPALALQIAASRGGVATALIALAVLIAIDPQRLRLLASLALAGVAAIAVLGFAGDRTAFLDRPGTELAAQQGDEVLVVLAIAFALLAAARYALDARIERLRVPRRLAIGAAALAAVVAVIAVASADPIEQLRAFTEPPTRVESAGGAERNFLDRGSSGRYQFWSAAVDAFESQPMTGVGAGGYETWWTRNGSLALPVRHAHSLYLESLAELGPLGLVLIAAFFAGTIAFALGRRAGLPVDPVIGAGVAIVAAGAAAAAAEWVWELPAVFAPVIVAAALLTGPATEPRALPQNVAPGVGGTRRRGLAVGIVTMIIAWGGICTAAVLFFGQRALEQSREAVDRGDFENAEGDARRAATLQPWAAEPHLQLALVYLRARDLGPAEAEAAEAVERAPDDWLPWAVKANINLLAGDYAEGRRDLDRVRVLNPRDPRVTAAIQRASRSVAD